jgi:phosphate transport system substrate-binding protein
MLMRKPRAVLLIGLAVTALFAVACPAAAQSPVDPTLPAYHPGEKLSGKLTLAGSTTMSHIASIWSDGFKQFHPDVKFDIQIKGAIQAVNSVVSEEAQLGLLSRDITRDEVAAFEAKFGYPPTILAPAYEGVAVFVHKDNPIQGLTLQQLDAIFSTTRLRGAKATAMTWGDLGLTGEWAARPIACQGRQKLTGVQVFFQDVVLKGGTFRTDQQANADSTAFMTAMTTNPGAIGFSGSTYVTPAVRAVPLAAEPGQPFVAVDSAEANRGQYPLVRALQLVINQPPKAELPALQQEFLKYVFSRFGQEDVLRAGMQPISARPAETALEAVGLGTIK